MKVDFIDDDLLIGQFLYAIETAVERKEDGLDFTRLCSLIGAEEKQVELCLLRNFGVSGSEITKVFSLNVPLFML